MQTHPSLRPLPGARLGSPGPLHRARRPRAASRCRSPSSGCTGTSATTSTTAAIRASSPRRTCSSSRACRASSSPRCCTAGCAGPTARNERRLPLRLSMSPGGIVMLVCGGVALLGFPLDAFWHALFGEDVTLWGPTHLFMIGGAGVSTLGVWMVMRQGFELGRPRKVARRGHLRVAGALIIGLSTFQAEFDFGVPQFQLLYQPVLIAFAAARRARVRALDPRALGRLPGAGDVLRHPHRAGAVRRPGRRATRRRTSRSTSPRPAVVELAALAAPRAPLRFALLSGLGIGTVGLAAEWGWSHVWMPHPWPASMLVPAVVLALAAALAGSVLGARMSQSLAMPESERAALPAIAPRAVALAARRRARGALLPAAAHRRRRHARRHRPDARGRRARRTSPSSSIRPTAARDNQWFEVLSWQGRTPGQLRQLTALRQVGAGPVRHRAPRAGERQLEDDAAPGQGHASDGAAGVPAALAAGQPCRRSRAPALGRDAAPTPSSCSARRAAAPRG